MTKYKMEQKHLWIHIQCHWYIIDKFWNMTKFGYPIFNIKYPLFIFSVTNIENTQILLAQKASFDQKGGPWAGWRQL